MAFSEEFFARLIYPEKMKRLAYLDGVTNLLLSSTEIALKILQDFPKNLDTLQFSDSDYSKQFEKAHYKEQLKYVNDLFTEFKIEVDKIKSAIGKTDLYGDAGSIVKSISESLFPKYLNFIGEYDKAIKSLKPKNSIAEMLSILHNVPAKQKEPEKKTLESNKESVVSKSIVDSYAKTKNEQYRRNPAVEKHIEYIRNKDVKDALEFLMSNIEQFDQKSKRIKIIPSKYYLDYVIDDDRAHPVLRFSSRQQRFYVDVRDKRSNRVSTYRIDSKSEIHNLTMNRQLTGGIEIFWIVVISTALAVAYNKS